MIAVLLVVPILMGTLTSGDDTPAGDTPVVANDGRDNFLILSDDEVRANPALLAYLSTANKADVEELVDSNPQFQEKIFDRIKAAVEARERQRQATEPPTPNETATIQPSRTAIPLGMPVETDTQAKGGGGGDDDDEDDDDDDGDDDHVIDKLRVAKIKASVTKSALKIFKIGKSLKGKLKQYLKKPPSKDKKKRKKKKKTAWPVFRYKVSTNRGDPNGAKTA